MPNEIIEGTESNLTPIVVKTKLESALIAVQSGIQTLHDTESKLVYNSDNLQNIADFIAKVKAAKKKVEDERVFLKKPHKDNGDAVDDGAKLVASELEQMLKKAGAKYTEMVTEQNRLKKIQDDEDARIKGIKDGMDNNIMSFSTKIAEAKDLQTLLDLERRLNLETAAEKKYAEFLPVFKERCAAIRALITLQKQNLKYIDEFDKKVTEALEAGNDEQLEDLEGKKGEISAKVEETRTRIQETAINQSTTTLPARATQVFNTVKPSRTTVEWKVEDINLLFAKAPQFVKLVPDEEAIKEYVKSRKAEITDGNPVIKFFGLSIYQKKTYV